MIRVTRKPKPLSREQSLALRPIRLIDVPLADDGNGGGRVQVPIRAPRYAHWLAKHFAGRTKTFELDAVGCFVWRQLDGQTSVEQLIRALASEYKLDLRQAEASTTAFLRTLMERGLVGMPIDKDPSAAPE